MFRLQPSGRVQAIAARLAFDIAPNADVGRAARLAAKIALAFAVVDPLEQPMAWYLDQLGDA